MIIYPKAKFGANFDRSEVLYVWGIEEHEANCRTASIYLERIACQNDPL